MTDPTSGSDPVTAVSRPADLGPWLAARIAQRGISAWFLSRAAEQHRVATYGGHTSMITEEAIRRRLRLGYPRKPQGETVAELRSVLQVLDDPYDTIAAGVGYPTAASVEQLARGGFPGFLNEARLYRGLSHRNLGTLMGDDHVGLAELLRGARMPSAQEWDELANVLELDFATTEAARHRFNMTDTSVESPRPGAGVPADDTHSHDFPRAHWGVGNYSRTHVLRAHAAQQVTAAAPTPSRRPGAPNRRSTRLR